MPTITIDNFSGKLTREIHGDMNSGFIPFVANFGGVYPFGNVSYESQLGFMEDVVSMGGSNLISPILHWANISNLANGTVAASLGIDLNGRLYEANNNAAGGNPDGDALGVISDVTYSSSAVTLYYGGGLYVGNTTATISAFVAYAGHDQGVTVASSMAVGGATMTPISGSWVQNVPRPIVPFVGNVYVGNGNNISEIISGNVQSTTAKLNPALPPNYTIRDMQISNDGRYLLMIATFLSDPTSTLKVNGLSGTSGNQGLYGAVDSALILWNGTDSTYSSFQFYKGVNLSSIVISNTEALLFGKDDEGSGLWDLYGNKIVPIPETSNLTASYPPLPGQNFALGKKIFFLMQYGSQNYLFCLDREDNSLYCLYFAGTLGSESVKGAVTIPSVHATNVSFTDISRSKIYFGWSKIPVSTQANNLLYYQHLQNYAGNIFSGIYSTQIQKFGRKIQPKEIRIYCQPTSSGISFSTSLLGSNGSPITNTTKTYTYSSGTDQTKAQGAMDMIRFSYQCKPLQSMGLQISNLGTTQVAINKVEIDYEEVPNPRVA